LGISLPFLSFSHFVSPSFVLFISTSQSLCICVIWLEIRSNHTHWWPVRVLWVLKFISIAAILQMLKAKHYRLYDGRGGGGIDRQKTYFYEEFGHATDYIFAMTRLVISGLLSCLGLYVKGGKYQLGYEICVF
jgi:hypothetical protein